MDFSITISFVMRTFSITLFFYIAATASALAWPIHVISAGLNNDSTSVVVSACQGRDELLLLCDVDADDCLVVSVGQHDLKGIAEAHKKSKYPGQNVVIDDAHVFQLHSTTENSYSCSQKRD